MDVGAPGNFERMLWLCGGDPEVLRFLGCQLVNFRTLEAVAARISRVDAADDLHQRRFARAILAKQRMHFARL